MIQQVKSLRLRYEKMLNSFTKEEFRAWFVEFFILYPFVKEVRWVQYTPYFNDGSPCVFGVDDPDLTLSEAYLNEHSGFPVDEGVVYSWQFNKDHAAAVPELAEAIAQLRELFTEEDLLKTVLGDHTEVRVNKKTLTCKEYEHE